jgi:hypothetical protein
MQSRVSALGAWAIVAVAACVFAAPAGAATIVNGDFETGNLSGWHVYNSTSEGNWFAFNAKEAEDEEVQPPISGTFSAYTTEEYPDTAILYQDVALEPLYSHQLSLTVGYRSQAPIVTANTLLVDPEVPPSYDNQQMRVDVMRPTAPLESTSSSDILTTVFANKTGDPQVMAPKQFSVDLSPFAGQTVRLRVVTSAGDSEFNTVLDDVSINSVAPPPPPPPPPSNAISRGKLTLNKKNGTGKLAILVPGPGTLTEVGKGKKKKVKGAALTVTAAGTIQVPLKPTALGRKTLKTRGKLKTGIEVTFTPTGGTANTQPYKITLKKTLKP